MLIMILGGGQDEDENNIRHMLAIKRREKESDGEPIALQDINCDVIPGSVRTLVQTFIHALKERQCSEQSFIFYLDQQLGATTWSYDSELQLSYNSELLSRRESCSKWLRGERRNHLLCL